MTLEEAQKRIGTYVKTIDFGGRERHGILKGIDSEGLCHVFYPHHSCEDYHKLECLQ